MLPPDGHVHTEWSWDTVHGSMVMSCQRAVELGLPSIAFTEHLDLTSWAVEPAGAAAVPEHLRSRLAGGWLTPPALDLAGYLECVDRCRRRFPELRILSGVELGEPHWHAGRLGELTAVAGLDRVLGSLHTLVIADRPRMVDTLVECGPAAEVIRAYLGELLRMIETGAGFTVLAHVDYPIRTWPQAAGPYRPGAFQDEFRAVLTALAGGGRALEINTQVPLHPQVVRWWYEVGGEAVCFGSDAHQPDRVAHGLATAAAMAEAAGFRPGRHPFDFWLRTGPANRTR